MRTLVEFERRAAYLNRLATASTLVLSFGLALSAAAVALVKGIDQVFPTVAILVGASLAAAIAIEARAGIRNLIRADLFMLLALFGLTLLEFLFPQDSIASVVSLNGAKTGAFAVLAGISGIAIGRLLAPMRLAPSHSDSLVDFRPSQMMFLISACFIIGYLPVFVAVKFHFLQAIEEMAQPRFTQSWSRGRYGSLSTIINELELVTYLVPPLAGAILAQWRRYSALSLIFTGALVGFTFYFGFAGATRNQFIVYVATFVTTLLLLQRRLTWTKAAAISLPAIFVVWTSFYSMLEIRTVGLRDFDLSAGPKGSPHIDMNAVIISRLTEIFPERHEFLGLEIPYNALIRPVPRGLWPSKPKGLTFGIEDALGADEGYTLSAAFVGELYMAGGILAVAVAGLVFGYAAGVWNRVGLQASSNVEIVLYASGFFAAGLLMRSLLSSIPALLPTLALLIYVKVRRKAGRRQLRRIRSS